MASIAICELDVAVPPGVALVALPGRAMKVSRRLLSLERASDVGEKSGRAAAGASSVTP